MKLALVGNCHSPTGCAWNNNTISALAGRAGVQRPRKDDRRYRRVTCARAHTAFTRPDNRDTSDEMLTSASTLWTTGASSNHSLSQYVALSPPGSSCVTTTW